MERPGDVGHKRIFFELEYSLALLLLVPPVERAGVVNASESDGVNVERLPLEEAPALKRLGSGVPFTFSLSVFLQMAIYRFLTALSVLPCTIFAISVHLLPCISCPLSRISSSSGLQLPFFTTAFK